MRKTGLLTFIAILLIAVTLTALPTLAVTIEYVSTSLYFNVQATQELSVTLINETSPTTSLVEGGANTTSLLNFTCASASCEMVNASLSGNAEAVQSTTTPALKIQNTGTQTAQLNITANVSGAFGGGTTTTCMKLLYNNATIYVQNNSLNNTVNITLDQSHVYNDIINVWLFGNFSACDYQTYIGEVRVYGYWT